jgi:very-short-patch-repair endonuclease
MLNFERVIRRGEVFMAKRDELLRYARENRKHPTKSEMAMWAVLRNKQLSELKFRRQHVIEPYVVDFACRAKMLIVEIDGGYHEFSGNADQERQSYLEDRGWRVLRFMSDDVESNAESVLTVIVESLRLEHQFVRRKYAPSGMIKGKNCPME